MQVLRLDRAGELAWWAAGWVPGRRGHRHGGGRWVPIKPPPWQLIPLSPPPRLSAILPAVPAAQCAAAHVPHATPPAVGGEALVGGVHPHWRAVAASIDATPAERLRLARELEAYLTKQYVVAARCQRAVAQLRLAIAASGDSSASSASAAAPPAAAPSTGMTFLIVTILALGPLQAAAVLDAAPRRPASCSGCCCWLATAAGCGSGSCSSSVPVAGPVAAAAGLWRPSAPATVAQAPPQACPTAVTCRMPLVESRLTAVDSAPKVGPKQEGLRHDWVG